MGNAGLSQPVTPSTPSNNIQNDLMNILGSSNNMGTSNNIMSPGAGLSNFTNLNLQPQKTVMLPASDGKGMEISAVFVKRQNKFFMELTFSNKTAQPLSEIAIQFNKNT